MANWPRVSINTDKDFSMCFACGQNNPIGLKLSFQWDGKTARAEFLPGEFYQGWSGTVHGGIITCILDEAMTYAAYFSGTNCATAEIRVRLRRPATINEPLTITSSVTKKTRKLVETKANISLRNGTLVAEGTSTHFVIDSPADAINKRAVIWDMDGVIADTAPYHFKSWQQVFKKRGVSFTKTDFQRNFGQRNDTIIRNVLGEHIPQSEIDIIASEKEKTFRQNVKQNIKPLPGAIELIKALKEHGFNIALASSAPVENIELVIRGLNINSYFHAIVSGKEVKEGKPSPQGFLLAAQRLGIVPENCIVIEDAVAGVAAAKRAGMHCLAVTNTHPRPSLMEADLVVDTLEAVGINDLEKLLNPQRKVDN